MYICEKLLKFHVTVKNRSCLFGWENPGKTF